MHKYWTDNSKDLPASKFEDTFCAYLTMEHELDSLPNLGVPVVPGVDTGPFSNCPVCAPGPEGEETRRSFIAQIRVTP